MRPKITPRPDKPFVFDLPQYTQIPNVVIDEIMAKVSGSEMKVLIYIVRRTLGFHRTEARITIAQICDGYRTSDGTRRDGGTGLSRRAVFACLNTLEEAGYIVRRMHEGKNGITMPSTYTILARTASKEVVYGDEAVENTAGVVDKEGDGDRVQKMHPGREGEKNAPYEGAESAPLGNKERNLSPIIPFRAVLVENPEQCNECGGAGLIGTDSPGTFTSAVAIQDAITMGAEYCHCEGGRFVRAMADIYRQESTSKRKGKRA